MKDFLQIIGKQEHTTKMQLDKKPICNVENTSSSPALLAILVAHIMLG